MIQKHIYDVSGLDTLANITVGAPGCAAVGSHYSMLMGGLQLQ